MRRSTSFVMIAVLAAILVVAVAGSALAMVPANNGAGQAYGQHHAEMARMGMIGMDPATGINMNPGQHHRGMSGWMGPMMP
jgi:hypothetical protein